MQKFPLKALEALKWNSTTKWNSLLLGMIFFSSKINVRILILERKVIKWHFEKFSSS